MLYGSGTDGLWEVSSHSKCVGQAKLIASDFSEAGDISDT